MHIASSSTFKLRMRQAQQEAAEQALGNAQRSSLRTFLNAYVGHLRRAGKLSAGDVESIFKNHAFTDPTLCDREAALASTEDFVSLISKVVTSGHGRTAAKLRSYLHAAYALGIRSKTDPAAPQAMREFGIKANLSSASMPWLSTTGRLIGT